MKKTALLALFVCATSAAFSIAIPKKLTGQYDAEIPSFEFEDNDRTLQASAYNISLALHMDYLWYYCGEIKFYGEYNSLTDDGENTNVGIAISNDYSVSFNMELSVNNKTHDFVLKGLKGVPETTLVKRKIHLEKKK